MWFYEACMKLAPASLIYILLYTTLHFRLDSPDMSPGSNTSPLARDILDLVFVLSMTTITLVSQRKYAFLLFKNGCTNPWVRGRRLSLPHPNLTSRGVKSLALLNLFSPLPHLPSPLLSHYPLSYLPSIVTSTEVVLLVPANGQQATAKYSICTLCFHNSTSFTSSWHPPFVRMV